MASKSKRRRRVLGASCILAALIVAGSSFAWFTSSDEVTNRLSASADYGAKIVESFAPPKNWIPGQKVDKDVYTTNTGDIGAYVGMDISGTLSIVKEEAVALAMTDKTTVTGKKVTYKESVDGEDIVATVDIADVDKYIKNGAYYPGGDADNGGTTSYTATTIEDITVTEQIPDSEKVYECIELTNDERYAVEAGAYLALKPATDEINKVGDLAVTYIDDDATTTTTYVYKAYKSGNTTDGVVEQDVELDAAQDTLGDNTDAGGDAYSAGYTKTITKGTDTYYVKSDVTPIEKENVNSTAKDFTPHADGLYVFRRSIDIDSKGFGDPAIGKGGETFTYDGYYYYGGKYYKIADLTVTPDDEADVAGDAVQTDGNLSGATFKLVKEITDYVDPVSLEYDNANHRLIATYSASVDGLDEALKTAAANLDEAEDQYASAELQLRRALEDASAEDEQFKTNTAARDTALKARNDAKEAYDAAKAKYEALRKQYEEANTEFGAAKTAVVNDIKALLGDDAAATIAIGTDSTKSLADNASATGTLDTSKLADKYNKAKKAYEDFVAARTMTNSYGDTDVTDIEHIYYAYLQELSEDDDIPYTIDPALTQDSGADALEAEIKRAVTAITYEKLKDYNPSGDDEVHQYHQLLTAYLLAKDNYEDGLKKYQDDVAKLNNIIDKLNQGATDNNNLKRVDTSTAVKASDINALDATKGKLYGALTTARGDYDGKTGDAVLSDEEGAGGKAGELATAEAALTEAENTLATQTNNVTGNEDVKKSLEDSWKRYYEAKNALAAARQAKDAAQKKYDQNADLKIYINLANDVLVGGERDKWQALPTTVVNNVAHFYYTSILEGGKTTTKLIDSVELDKDVTEDMYKYFDFDVNVAMKSAQITYAEDNKTITAEATPKEVGATATLTTPTDIKTPITWSANP